MKEHVVLPLLSMVGELQRRQEELFKILNRKDYEIQEYRNTGAILSRRKTYFQVITSNNEFLDELEIYMKDNLPNQTKWG